MPPEKRRDAAWTDHRSDLWSQAATLYQMVTGASPKVIRLKKVPAKLRDNLDKALEEARADQYSSAGEFRAALMNSKSGGQSTAPVFQDVDAGECPQCHTLNESSRKFCRECAAPLLIPCLQCSEPIAIWDKVCGECGVRQQDLLDARLGEFQQREDRAELLQGQYEYEPALAIATDLSGIGDDRLSQFRLWEDEFAASVNTEWKQQQGAVRQHFNEAKKHREVFDYDSAIAAIELVPEALLTSDMKSYFSSLESDRSELASLVSEIRTSIQQRDLDELLPKVERALALSRDHADLITLHQQLMTRNEKLVKKRDETCVQAAVLLKERDARAALKLVERVRVNLTISQQDLVARVKGIVFAEAELSSLLKDAKLDGVVDSKEVVELLLKTVG